jgi:hypothetical protein
MTGLSRHCITLIIGTFGLLALAASWIPGGVRK